jgi:hypothetical protein
MPTWPVSVPKKILYEGFEGAFPSRAIETQMDTGPMKVRPRFTAAPEPYRGKLVLTTAQLNDFYTFFETTLGGGALVFDGLPHPRTGAAVNHQFSKPSEPPKYRKLTAGVWEIEVALQVMP